MREKQKTPQISDLSTTVITINKQNQPTRKVVGREHTTAVCMHNIVNKILAGYCK
jgi:hypothetical protein